MTTNKITESQIETFALKTLKALGWQHVHGPSIATEGVIAREIAEKVRANATIDWTIRESARAKLMVVVRRTLNKYGYPLDKQKQAIETVLKQAELLANHFMQSRI